MKKDGSINSANLGKYEIGRRLYHFMFGQGQITDVDKDVVTIRFDTSGIKKLSITVCEEQRLVKLL